jgi:acyl carrier protein
MTRDEFLLAMDEALEVPGGTLKGPEKLEDLDNWDSVAMMSFIALVNSNNSNLKLSPRQITSCDTVDDLLKLAQVDGDGKLAI